MPSYSIDVIDRMRNALYRLHPSYYNNLPSGMYMGDLNQMRMDEGSRTSRMVEDKLRTYMTAGVTAEELEEKARMFEKKAQDLKEIQEKNMAKWKNKV